MKILLTLVCFLSLAHALSKNEIETIRKELNAELTQLEDENTKRANNQVASTVIKNDEDAELDSLLRHLIKKDKTSSDSKEDIFGKINLDKKGLWDEMTKDQKARDEANSKRSTTAEEKLKELGLENHFDKTEKRSQDGDKAGASLDALAKLLKSEAKKSTESKREVVADYGRYISPEECHDQRKDCGNFKEYCSSPEYRLMMRKRCPYTCGACMKCVNDKWPKVYCDRIVKLKMCSTDNELFKHRIKDNCFASCGFCRANAPPPCSFDPQGCCWDGNRFAKDGCYPCKDNERIAKVCENFKEECTNKFAPGKYMKTHCPVKCGFCDPNEECHDHFSYKEKCKEWVAKGECNMDSTRAICPRSCNACHGQLLAKKVKK